MEATAGVEPAIRVLQTPALPLGYVAPVGFPNLDSALSVSSIGPFDPVGGHRSGHSLRPRAHPISGLPLHRRRDVAVDVFRRPERGWAEGLQRNAQDEHERGGGVPQVVEPSRLKPDVAHQALRLVGDVTGVQLSARRVREDQPLRSVRDVHVWGSQSRTSSPAGDALGGDRSAACSVDLQGLRALSRLPRSRAVDELADARATAVIA